MANICFSVSTLQPHDLNWFIFFSFIAVNFGRQLQMNANLNHIHLCAFYPAFFAMNMALMIIMHYFIIIVISEFAMNWNCFNSFSIIFSPFGKWVLFLSFIHFRFPTTKRKTFQLFRTTIVPEQTVRSACMLFICLYIHKKLLHNQKHQPMTNLCVCELEHWLFANKQHLAREMGKITYSF